MAEIQQALGIAWVRDVARWKDFIGTARNTPDPFIDYLDRHNICWLPILDYVDANHGWQDENGIWRWDEDVTNIKKYVEMNRNCILVVCVFERDGTAGRNVERIRDEEMGRFQGAGKRGC